MASTMNDGIVLKEINSDKEYLVKLPCVIGRDRDSDLVLSDMTVSHRHALVGGTTNQIWIQDLNSTNGTLVNGLKVTDKTTLQPGDSIQFGQNSFLYPGLKRQEEIEETQIIHTLGGSAELPFDFKRLELIYAITAELPEGHDVKDLGEKIFRLFKEYFKQDRGYIALFEEDGTLLPLCSAPPSQPIPLSNSIVNRIFTNGESFVLTDALANDSFKEQESVIAMHIRSAMCAPLTFYNQIYGLIYLDRNIAYAYKQEDLELFRSIAAIIAPPIENARLRIDLQQNYDYRKTIKAISEKMIRILDAEQIYKTLIGSVVQEMSLKNGVLLLPNADNGLYKVRIAKGDTPEKLQNVAISEEENIFILLKEKNEVIQRHQIDLDPDYEENRKQLQDTFEAFSSELMLPLTYHDEVRGIISFGRKNSGKRFLQEDIDLLKTITNQSSVALENVKLFEENLEKTRMEEELKIAHDIQVSMLPDQSPHIEGYSIAASSYPAREVGGDFYDFIKIGKGDSKKLGIIVGDVSGKAVSGALVMAASRSIFRVLADSEVSVSDMMLSGNRYLKHDIKKGMFVALVYALLDPLGKTLTIVNAGQTQPIICSRKSEKPLLIDTEGDRFPLGIIDDCDYRETIVSLTAGDTVVLYTDGIVEAMNEAGEMYGFDQFMKVIAQNCDLEADAFVRKLMADVTYFAGDAEQHDDLTIVAVKVE